METCRHLDIVQMVRLQKLKIVECIMNISILCALFNMPVTCSHKPSKELELTLTSADFIAHC